MLSKNVDHTVVGHNFFAYFYAKILLENKQSVIFLDDQRYDFGSFFSNNLTRIDLLMLQQCGRFFHITPFKAIEKYVSTKCQVIVYGDRKILLGVGLKENFLELQRKFPELFQFSPKLIAKFKRKYKENFQLIDLESLENIYEDFENQFYNRIFQPKTLFQTENPFQMLKKHPLLIYIELMITHLNEELAINDHSQEFFTRWEPFLSTMRCFLHGVMAKGGTHNELLHLFLSLLSPWYQLSHQEFKSELKNQMIKKGAEYKKLELNSFKFQSHNLQSFKLDSFDGAIFTKSMSFIGGSLRDLPLEISTSRKKFNGLVARGVFSKDLECLIPYDQQNIFFSSYEMIGTDRPVLSVNFKKQELYITFIILEQKASKVEFYQGILQKLLQRTLEKFFHQRLPELTISDLQFNHDLFVFDHRSAIELSENRTRSLNFKKLFNRRRPDLLDPIKNVYYLGPLNENFLGTMSSLLAIKNKYHPPKNDPKKNSPP